MSVKNTDRKDYVISGSMFLFFAIPGLFLFLGSSIVFVVRLLAETKSTSRILFTAALMDVAMVLMLVGVGRWWRWKYLLIFLFLPFVLIFYVLIGGTVSTGITGALLIAAIAIIAYYLLIAKEEKRTLQFPLIASSTASERCAFCGAPDVKIVYRTKLFGKGTNAVVMENVPVQDCESCGESYYDPAVAQKIDDLLSRSEKSG
ncbi:MAG TPA: type II toxin-antitoxin system MqsA family antitoxin [Blastocatellia bacterium]|nr:type II toxin-antitoxin system MqsA family antitoxin [Blastocatellia bacterium]